MSNTIEHTLAFINVQIMTFRPAGLSRDPHGIGCLRKLQFLHHEREVINLWVQNLVVLIARCQERYVHASRTFETPALGIETTR